MGMAPASAGPPPVRSSLKEPTFRSIANKGISGTQSTHLSLTLAVLQSFILVRCWASARSVKQPRQMGPAPASGQMMLPS